MSTDPFARAAAALLADLDLKVKRQIIAEDEKARVRFLQERKIGHQTAKEPIIDGYLRAAVGAEFTLRQRLFHEWLRNADVPAVPNFDELATEADDKGKTVRTFQSDAKTVTALKKLLKSWLDEAENRLVEIYAYMGPYEFPEKVLSTIPEALPEAPDDEEKDDAAGAAALEALKVEYEKKLTKQAGELDKIKKLLDSAKEKREADLSKAEEGWKREKDQLQAKLAESTSSSRKLQEEVSSKSQPISQLKRDLEDTLRQNEKLTKDLAEAKTSYDAANKQRDEAVGKRTTLEADLAAAIEGATKLASEAATLAKEAESADTDLTYFREAKTWMMVDASSIEELKESIEGELDIRSAFSKIFNLDLSKKGSFQHRAIDFQGVWKKLLAEETEIVDDFFKISLQESLKEGLNLKDAASRLYDLKDSLLAREMAALALNHICNRFLDKKKVPPTPAAK